MSPRNDDWQKSPEWIGVDLDGTLAEFTEWKGMEHIGKPLSKMVDRILQWLREGKRVKILTARANTPEAIPPIEKWLVEEAGLPVLEITNVKGHNMRELWDDRCRQVVPNTGEPVISDPLHALITQPLPAGWGEKDPEQFTLLRQLEDASNDNDEEDT